MLLSLPTLCLFLENKKKKFFFEIMVHKHHIRGKHHKTHKKGFFGAVNTLLKDAKSGVSVVHKDVRDAVKGAGKLAKTAITEMGKTTRDMVNAPMQAWGGVGKAAVWPLAIGAVALGGIYLLANKK